MNKIDPTNLQDWVSCTESAEDTLIAAHARRVAALLDHAAAPGDGDPLPPLWHWFYFAPATAQSELGADGHPERTRTGFMPPITLPRRMWAGGRLTFHRPLRVGDTVTKDSEITAVTEKTGKQGALVFLTMKHRLSDASGLAIEEEQDIVYRDHSKTEHPAPGDSTPGCNWRDRFDPDPVMLFRYSALTFNAHRIHYDLPYATQEEGYPGLVVQGPLTATLMMDRYLVHVGETPHRFSFRGKAPLFSGGAVELCGRRRDSGKHDIWAEGPGGYTAMTASVSTK